MVGVAPLAPDASTRRFFRLEFTDRPSLVASVYPHGEEARLVHDWAVQQWACRHHLPVPAPLTRTVRVILSADLGGLGLDAVLRQENEFALHATLACLQTFQACVPREVPNPPFDRSLFRRELDGFTGFLDPHVAAEAGVQAFLDWLSRRLEQHPYRVAHRDFHANNLLLHNGRVWAVDFQDLRLGPDTYDLVSLLRERAGGEVIAKEEPWCAEAAELLGWQEGWRERYLECACQRGLKVLGTFLRLAGGGVRSYLAYIPVVARKSQQALVALRAPRLLVDAVASMAETSAYNRPGEEP